MSRTPRAQPLHDNGMLRLYLVRHAIAEELPDEQPFADPLRALTAKGRRQFRRSARAFAGLEEQVDLICASPVLRAVQTAELLAGALGDEEVRVLDELRPDAGVAPLRARLAELKAGSVALVGHKRLLSELAVTLAGLPLEDASRLRLKRGAIARIDVRGLSSNAAGKPRWWLGRAGDAVHAGLPLLEGALR